MRHKRLALLICCLATLLSSVGILLALQSQTVQVTSEGSMTYAFGIQIFEDAAMTKPMTHIAWGVLTVGETKQKAIYLYNTGSLPIRLSFSTANWNPATAEPFLSFSWSHNNSLLQPKLCVISALKIIVSASIHDIYNFTVNLLFNGTETS